MNDQKEKLMGSSRAKLQKKYSAQFQELISYGSKNNLPLNQILEVWDNFLDEQEKASFNKSSRSAAKVLKSSKPFCKSYYLCSFC